MEAAAFIDSGGSSNPPDFRENIVSDNHSSFNSVNQTPPLSEILTGGKSNNYYVELSAITSAVTIESVTRYFGGSRYRPDEATIKHVRSSINTASKLVIPQATYTLFTVSRVTTGKEVILETGTHLNVPDCLEVGDAQLVSVVIGSLGAGLENYCRSLAAKGEIYQSTLYDAIGTALLDLLSEEISGRIEQTCTPYGLMNGPRFAPGIDNYPLEHQHQLFRLADGKSIGVTLNSSVIMVPTKSISFFQTLSKSESKHRAIYKCGQCRLTNCQFRMTARNDTVQHE